MYGRCTTWVVAGALLGPVLSGLVAMSAAAEVRIGKNVRVGGNPVAPETFNTKRRGYFVIHRTSPPNPGCRWRSHPDGSRTKVCHYQRRTP